MPDENNNGGPPESMGDAQMALVRGEVAKQIQELMAQFIPNGDIPGLMNSIASQILNEVIPRLPEIDYEKAGKKALELARVEMAQTAQDIGSQIEAKAAGANGSGPGAPTSNGGGGHFEGDGHDHGNGEGEQAAPQGYVFPKVTGAANMGQAFKMAVFQDPLTAINFIFDKLFQSMDKWGSINKRDDVTVLQAIRQSKPELFNMFVPNPWGPEFQKMQEDTWKTAMRVKMANERIHPSVGPGDVLNPFAPGGMPNVGYTNGNNEQRRPLFGESVSPNESGEHSTGDTVQASRPEFVTLNVGRKTMVEMMVGDR